MKSQPYITKPQTFTFSKRKIRSISSSSNFTVSSLTCFQLNPTNPSTIHIYTFINLCYHIKNEKGNIIQNSTYRNRKNNHGLNAPGDAMQRGLVLAIPSMFGCVSVWAGSVVWYRSGSEIGKVGGVARRRSVRRRGRSSWVRLMCGRWGAVMSRVVALCCVHRDLEEGWRFAVFATKGIRRNLGGDLFPTSPLFLPPFIHQCCCLRLTLLLFIGKDNGCKIEEKRKQNIREFC